MISRPPSREPLPFWLSDAIVMLPGFFSTSSQPLTRSITAETGGPFMIATLPPSFRWSTMYWQDFWPASMLLVWTVASAPLAETSTATTTMPAACARLIAGSIASGSAALTRIRSTPEAMKLSICEYCLLRS